MEKNENASNFIKRFFLTAALLLILCAATVILFDPFYHYHKPLPGLKAVLSDKEYQVPGTLDHFDYDAVIAGSSVAENNNNRWYDEAFGCRSVKAIRSYGATADLCYYLDRAFEKHTLRYVFFNLDPSSLVADPEGTTFESVGAPMFLYDKNPANDVKYLWNKAVLFEKIPYLLANSYIGDYDEGASYNWAQWKSFDEDTALYHYIQSPVTAEMKPSDTYLELCRANTALLTDRIASHPETEFYIFVPPYSVLWWDSLYRDGDTDAYLEMEYQAFSELIRYDNVHLYNFQNANDISTDLKNYTDSLHFSPEINRLLCGYMKDGKYELKSVSDIEASLRELEELGRTASGYVERTYKDRIKVAVVSEDE
ncbi:MAG: SGNH/GDSL hydrolase family protein [Lachnospiraceae bacterium]|nr:SGNH/GDSL hydrolase family protein [Lachnospiraceae bacterium]